jgi:sec-independent protein translocase protein TatC
MTRGRHHDDDRHMTLRDHIQELSRRFLLLVSILLVASSLVYVYRASIIPIILQPLGETFGDQKLMYLNPAGGFNFIFLISIYAGLAAVAPFVIQQLYVFIRPTLPKAAQRLSVKLLLTSFLLMIAGILFGYYIAVPGALKFLVEFAGEYVSAALTADSYLNFLIAYTLGLGLLFQIPFVIIIGHYIKPFTPTGLMKSERWAIVLTFIAAAIITPTPDPINLLIVALPIVLIYQIGIVTVLISIFKKRRSERKHAAAEPQRPFVPLLTIVESDVNAPEAVVTLASESTASPSLSRSIDGVVRASRPAPTQIRVPARTQPSVRQPAATKQHGRPRRYIDGMSVMALGK